MANQIVEGMIVHVREGEDEARCQVYRIETFEDVCRRFGSHHFITAHLWLAVLIWPNVRIAWIGEPIAVPPDARAAGIEAASHVFPVLIAKEGGEYRYLQLCGGEIDLQVIANPRFN